MNDKPKYDWAVRQRHTRDFHLFIALIRGNLFTIMNDSEKLQPKGLPAAQAVTAAGWVNYQDGSIVSREIVHKPTGTVTLFAFDEGQGLSEHTAPFDALVLLLDGEAEITIAGKPHLLQAGQMILMPARQPHALKATKKFVSGMGAAFYAGGLGLG
jgi:quercetin dioxygenase-like cupin family protein